eukprot:scaffold110415_cov62-Phaeocystis_antarctica.AAC.6
MEGRLSTFWLARHIRSAGWHLGRSLPWAAKGAMKTSRPVDARLWAAREDPGLQSELGGESTHDRLVVVTSTRRASIVI